MYKIPHILLYIINDNNSEKRIRIAYVLKSGDTLIIRAGNMYWGSEAK